MRRIIAGLVILGGLTGLAVVRCEARNLVLKSDRGRRLVRSSIRPGRLRPDRAGKMIFRYRKAKGRKALRPAALLARKMGKRVTVRGFYYDGTIPMIIDDIRRVRVNLPFPDSAYMPLDGKLPGVKIGDRVSVTARLVKPSRKGPKRLRREKAVLAVGKRPVYHILAKSSKKLAIPRFVLPRFRFRFPRHVFTMKKKYAVLISGGLRPAKNYPRYWNDLKAMYDILRNSGFAAEDIFVIYADGVARTGGMPVNYSATRANISTVFSQLASKMTDNDLLYIMTNDHGGGILTRHQGGYGPGLYGGVIDTNGDEHDIHSEAALNLDINGDGDKNDHVKIDEVLCLWGQNMTDDEFAFQVNKIQHYSKMIIQMEQCFSGGFVEDLTGPRRIIMSACNGRECSWGGANYNEWTFHVLSALAGLKPDGSGAVDADGNHNGKVSMTECFNFALNHDNADEHPCYEDNGMYPPRSGAVPLGSEGVLGVGAYLK